MQTTGKLIVIPLELAACVQARHRQSNPRQAGARVQIHRDAATIVTYGEAVIGVPGHLDTVAYALERLIDAVAHPLDEQVMEPPGTRPANIHGRPLANRL